MIELIVMCHNTVAEIVNRHLPNWEKAGFEKISFVSPRDDAFFEDFNRSHAKQQVEWNIEKILKPIDYLYYIGNIEIVEIE
jgi:hypothetical protein